MANVNPPIKAQAWSITIGLKDYSTPGRLKSSPTIAAGDFKFDKDGAGLNNMGTLPVVTPAASKSVLLTFSGTEMNADIVTIICSDQTDPPEWEDILISIQTVAGDAFARLGAPAGASVSADIAAVKSDTAAILVDTGTTLDGRIPAALVGGRMDSSVGAMADNVMTAAAAAADLTTELQAGLATSSALANVQSDTDDIQTRLPAALVGGRIDATVDGTGLEAGAAAVIADAVWDEAIAGHVGAGSTGEALNNAGAGGTPPTVSEIVNGVWDEDITTHSDPDSAGEALQAAGSAGDPWITALPGAYSSGQAGKILGDNLNATISSRAVAGDAMALTSGERTTLAGVIWDSLTSALTAVGSIGKLLVDNVNATISSRLASASYTTPPTVGAIADQVWDEAIAGHVGAGSTGETLSDAGGAGTPPTVAEIADGVWEEILSDHSGVSGSTAEALENAESNSGAWQ